MALDKRERIIENLAVASALGLLALVVGVVSFFADSRVAAEERAALAPAGASIALAGRSDDPTFGRFYLIQADSGPAYAAVITLRSAAGSALIAARFTPRGEVMDLRFLGSCASRLSQDPKNLALDFPDVDEVLARASAQARYMAKSGTEPKS